MVNLRLPLRSDAPDVAQAWNDARELYSGMDSRVFLPPQSDDEGLGAALVEWLHSIGERDDGFVRVAEVNDTPAGFITATLHLPIEDAHREIIRDMARRHVKIDVLVVKRDHWRHGIGRQLVASAEAWATSVDASLVKVGTYAHNPLALGFYDSLGYGQRSVIFEKYL